MTTTRLNGFSAGKRLLVSVIAEDHLSGNTLTYVNARAEILIADGSGWTDAPIRGLSFDDIASLVPALQSAGRYMTQFGAVAE